MDNLTVASEASKRYVVAAHTFGSTVAAIIEDLNTHGHDYVTEEDIRDILKYIGQHPKSEYLWENWIMRATGGQISASIHPWNSWSSRFIANSKANNQTNSTIFTKMRKRGYEVPGEHWVQFVLYEHRLVENGLARGCGTYEDAALENIIVMAHNWGYTVPEIAYRIFGSTPSRNRSTSTIKMALESNGIPEVQHRNGRNLGVVAQEFVVSAYNLGMHVDNIRDQMYVHGFDHSDPQPIIDLLKTTGIWQGQKLERAGPRQAAQPMLPRDRDNVLPGEGQVVSESTPANREPGRRINVIDLLN